MLYIVLLELWSHVDEGKIDVYAVQDVNMNCDYMCGESFGNNTHLLS